MSGMATAQGWTRHWLAAEFREKGKKLDCRDTTRRHAKLSTCQKGCPRRHAKTRLSPSTCKKNCLRRHAKQDCLCPHAKKIVSVDMQKCSCRHARGDCLRRHAKKDCFPSTCQTRLSPSTRKKDCSCRHAKKDCLRRHAKKIVPVDMQKNCHRPHANTVVVDMPKPGCPPTCQNPSSTSLELSPSTCQGVLSVNLPRGLVSFVHRPNHLLEWQNHSPTSPWAISVHTDKSCVLQRS